MEKDNIQKKNPGLMLIWIANEENKYIQST